MRTKGDSREHGTRERLNKVVSVVKVLPGVAPWNKVSFWQVFRTTQLKTTGLFLFFYFPLRKEQ